ncbi:MAG: hypothetical protein R3F61_11120 [Myxococcota bacterium]
MRMAREVVGQQVTVERPLHVRLHGRTTDLTPWEGFEVGGSRDPVWDHHAVPMSQFRMPEAGPNAPLLKRVIRYPISMEPSAPKREQVFDGSREKTRRPVLERVPMIFRENAESRSAPGPMAELDLGPELRPHPFFRARVAHEERGER